MIRFSRFLSIPRSRMISWSHDVFATIKQSRTLNPDLSHVAVNLTRLSERTGTFFTCRYEWWVTRCHMCEKWPLCGCDGCQLFQMMIEWHKSTLWKHEPLVSRRPLKQATVANLFVVQPPPLSLCTSVRSVCVCVCRQACSCACVWAHTFIQQRHVGCLVAQDLLASWEDSGVTQPLIGWPQRFFPSRCRARCPPPSLPPSLPPS